MIFPNPLNPKLPDSAIVDVRVPPTSRLPGGVADAGFFGEKWAWRGEGDK
jgi:hypothetical protein